MDIRTEIVRMKIKAGFLLRKDCTKQENEQYVNAFRTNEQLPNGVYQYMYDNGQKVDRFYQTERYANVADADVEEYMKYKQFVATQEIVRLLSLVKNYLLFFFIIACIGLFFGLVLWILSIL